MKSYIEVIIIGANIEGQLAAVLDLINIMSSYKVIGYLDNKINLSEDEPSLYYDTYDPESLESIINDLR